MPELPEVETVRRSLAQLRGSRILAVTVHDARLRRPIAIAALTQRVSGRRVLDVRRRAKYLLFDIEGGSVMLVHLGMSGRLCLLSADAPAQRHDHVVWRLEDGRELRYNDPRRFGLIDAFGGDGEATHPALCKLGVEPLDKAFGGALLFRATRGIARPIKSFLLDGTRVVGIGNIYACEALFRAGIHPATPARRLARARNDELVRAIRATLRSAIARGGTTLRNFANTDGKAGYFKVRLQVYGREGEPCRRCASPIVRMVQAGRSTFYCPGCQTR